MGKQKIAILGGGMAALAAAYQLSKTDELRSRYKITVYQLGWRLGGKCATGRNEFGRIQEHGLHFWFGCYENAFAMLKEVYSSWSRKPDNPLRNWTDALKPQDFTPIGELDDGKLVYWPLHWPDYKGSPGDGTMPPAPMDIVLRVVNFASDLLDSLPQFRGLHLEREIPEEIVRLHQHALAAANAPPSELRQSSANARPRNLLTVCRAVGQWISAFAGDPDTHGIDHHNGIQRLLAFVRDDLREAATRKALPQFLVETIDVALALAKGVISDVLLSDNAKRVDLHNIEFREWLTNHGADSAMVRHSAVLRALYDTAMQYENGDFEKPNMAASTGIIVCVRLLATTKGAMLWRMELGMGEAVIAPIYEVLKQRKVNFKFFRRVDHLKLSGNGALVNEIHLSRQVDTERGPYIPTESIDGLICWPAEPLWYQLKDGNVMRQKGINFESHWCDYPPVCRETLCLKKDFDHVILAISLGEFKRLNDDPSLASEVMKANERFRTMTETIGLIPTQSFQMWCKQRLIALGWNGEKPAAVAWPEPFSIWSDMTQSLKYESGGPGSVQYFCGPYKTQTYRQPRSRQEVPGQALTEVKTQAIHWLEQFCRYFLPNTVDNKGHMNWDFLYSVHGVDRFNYQFWRANVDPGECIPASNAGSVGSRLKADESGIKNLFLAGCWVRTGFNLSCVEGAVMAGMQAARAISGEPKGIVGEDLFGFDKV